MGYEIEFYETENGRIPVNDFIMSLQSKAIAKILHDLELLKDFGSQLFYPHVASIQGDKYDGLKELRTKQSNNIFRTFYFVVTKNEQTGKETAVLLHIIQKKTQKTPKKELEIALARMKDYLIRGKQ